MSAKFEFINVQKADFSIVKMCQWANKSLGALMTGLLGGSYSMNPASYDLTRLRRNGLITCVPGRAAETRLRSRPS